MDDWRESLASLKIPSAGTAGLEETCAAAGYETARLPLAGAGAVVLRDEMAKIPRVAKGGFLLYGVRNTSWSRSERQRTERCDPQSAWVAVSARTVHVRGAERNFYTQTLRLLDDNSTAPGSFFREVQAAYHVRWPRKRQLEPRALTRVPVYTGWNIRVRGGTLVLSYDKSEAVGDLRRLQQLGASLFAPPWDTRHGAPIPLQLGRLPLRNVGQKFANWYHWQQRIATAKPNRLSVVAALGKLRDVAYVLSRYIL